MKLQKIEKNSWYVCIKDIYNSKGEIEFQSGQVYHAPKDNYLIRDDNGQPEIIGAFLIEHFKLWSVKDAKPGDFLTYSSDEHKDWYFIYHSEYKPYDSHHHYFAGYSDKFLSGGTACIDEDGLRPSTNEECDLLLHKIEEAGYHWDAENRKLIKNKEENEVKQKMTDEESIIQCFGEWQHEMVRKTGFVYGYVRQVVRNFLNGFEEPGNNYFKWEVIHLIEKALQHKDEGVKAYARKLAQKYNKDGQGKYADCILSAIGEKEVPMATMDEKTERMTVITLCGSTRFKEQFLEQQKRLTLEGNVVISVGLFGHSGDEEVWKPGMKEMLDKMHFQKIDMADEIFVINVGGYIGESTKREIAYAKSKGKIINSPCLHKQKYKDGELNLAEKFWWNWQSDRRLRQEAQRERDDARKALQEELAERQQEETYQSLKWKYKVASSERNEYQSLYSSKCRDQNIDRMIIRKLRHELLQLKPDFDYKALEAECEKIYGIK